jgi:NAD+ kinase
MTVAIIGNKDKPGLVDAVARLVGQLQRSGTGFVLEEGIGALLADSGIEVDGGCVRGVQECVEGSDLLVAFGGDGTILAAARLVGARGTPILGVNLGKLGFLAELSPDDMSHALEDILAGKFAVEERLVLEATTPAMPGKVVYAVNDIVVDKSRSSRLIDVHLHIDGAFAVTYRGDGLIVSTPTGSTGYALSNNGPIVIPTSGVIGITPIAPHTLSGRPLIVPETSEIRIEVRADSDEVLLSSDGQAEALVRPPTEVRIRKAPFPVRLVKRMDRSFFDVLRAKLFWGADARTV